MLIVLCFQNNTKLILCLFVALVIDTVELDELAIGKGAGKIGLTAVHFKTIEFIVVDQCLFQFLGIVEQEVTVADERIERAIHSLYLRICCQYLPTPYIAEGICITVHGIHHIALYIGKQSQIATV